MLEWREYEYYVPDLESMECLLDAELMKTCKENDLKISRSSPEWPLDDTGLNENASHLVREKSLRICM